MEPAPGNRRHIADDPKRDMAGNHPCFRQRRGFTSRRVLFLLVLAEAMKAFSPSPIAFSTALAGIQTFKA